MIPQLLVAGPKGVMTIENFKHHRRKKDNPIIATRACNGRPSMVEFESLPEKYKNLYIATHGNPYENHANEAIEQYLIPHQADLIYLDNYIGPDGRFLPPKRRRQLTEACKVLNLLYLMDQARKTGGNKAAARLLGLDSMATAKNAISRHIKNLKKQKRITGLPASPAKLNEKKKRYCELRESDQSGAACLIHGNLGNKSAAKIASEEQASILRALIGRHQNFDYETVAIDYNRIAKTKDWPTITSGAVKYFDRNPANRKVTQLGKRGKGAYRDQYDIVVKRSRPSAPLYYLTIDGKSAYELYYQSRNDKGQTIYHKRKSVVVVLDPFNSYPLGYAIGDGENVSLIQAAVKNAVDHVRELTGSYCLPWQIQSDNYAAKQMTRFYESLATFTPAAVGNARAKLIESWFAQHDRKYVKRHFNYSGHNIDAVKKNQPNTEALDAIKKDFPDEHGVIDQIHAIFAQERSEKQAEWLAAFNKLKETDRREITRAQYLELLGHTTGYTNRLTNKGVEPTLLGETRSYFSFNPDHHNYIGLDFTVKFDPADLSDVLLINADGTIKFQCHEKPTIPMALRDHNEQTQKQLSQMRALKKLTNQRVLDQAAVDQEHINELLHRNPELEGMIKGRFTINGQQKQYLQEARQTTPPPARNRELTQEEIRQRALDDL